MLQLQEFTENYLHCIMQIVLHSSGSVDKDIKYRKIGSLLVGFLRGIFMPQS